MRGICMIKGPRFENSLHPGLEKSRHWITVRMKKTWEAGLGRSSWMSHYGKCAWFWEPSRLFKRKGSHLAWALVRQLVECCLWIKVKNIGIRETASEVYKGPFDFLLYECIKIYTKIHQYMKTIREKGQKLFVTRPAVEINLYCL